MFSSIETRKEKLGKSKRRTLFGAVVLCIACSVFILTLAMNISLRFQEIYSFYFNDTRVLDHVHTLHNVNEMSEEITHYLNSFSDEAFQVYDDTGYDREKVFSEEDGNNFKRVKRALMVSAVISLVSFIIGAAIFIRFINREKKKLLRLVWKLAIVCQVFGIALFAHYGFSEARTGLWAGKLGIKYVAETSALRTLLGGAFVPFITKVFIVVAVILTVILACVSYRIIKKQRLFY